MKRVLPFILTAAMLCVMLAGCAGSENADPGSAEQVTQPQESAQTPNDVITPADQFAAGTGTAEDPYQIGDAAQLALLAQLMNGDTYSTYGSAYYELTSDIALNDVSEGDDWTKNPPDYVWEPIGAEEPAFTFTLVSSDTLVFFVIKELCNVKLFNSFVYKE